MRGNQNRLQHVIINDLDFLWQMIDSKPTFCFYDAYG